MIVCATSLGDVHTMMLYPAMASHRDLSPKHRERLGIRDNLVRISTGIEAIEDIIADLEQALGRSSIENRGSPAGLCFCASQRRGEFRLACRSSRLCSRGPPCGARWALSLKDDMAADLTDLDVSPAAAARSRPLKSRGSLIRA